MADNYRDGSHYVIDDRTGFKVRAEDTMKEYTGARVSKSVHEPRHPLDFLRARRDDPGVRDPRPPQTPTFNGPLMTEIAVAAAAGALTLTVISTVRFEAGDNIGIMLALSRDLFKTRFVGAADSVTMTIETKLPEPVEVGAAVVNYTALAVPNLG